MQNTFETIFDDLPLGPWDSGVLQLAKPASCSAAILTGRFAVMATPSGWNQWAFGPKYLRMIDPMAFVMFMGQANTFGGVFAIDDAAEPNPAWQLSILNRKHEMQIAGGQQIGTNGKTADDGAFGNSTVSIIPASNGFAGGWIVSPIIGRLYVGNEE